MCTFFCKVHKIVYFCSVNKNIKRMILVNLNNGIQLEIIKKELVKALEFNQIDCLIKGKKAYVTNGNFNFLLEFEPQIFVK